MSFQIQCTSGNSNVEGLRIYDNPSISWTVTATKREHDLFCFVGTDIFVHELISHGYEGPIKCSRGSDCPICANREYLESLGELKPKVTGNERTDEMLAMNLAYWSRSGEPVWVRNWLLLHNEFIVKHSPKCSKCNELIKPGLIFGCDGWVKRIKKGICYDCDGQYQAEVRRLEREYSTPRRLRRIKQHDQYSLGSAQKGLEDFLKVKAK